MRLNLTAAAMAAGLCLIACGIAQAEVSTVMSTSYALRPCSTCKEVAYPTEAQCIAAGQAEALRVGETRTTGSAVYTCVVRHNVIATFRATPAPPVCPPAPSPRTQACPQGYTGSWEQSATVGAPPICTVTWSPTTAPSGACTPIPVEPTNIARLSWTPPTRNTNGSTLNNLAGYRIHYGRSATALAQTISVGNVSRHTAENLAPGTWYFAVRAVNSAGAESDLSNVVSKVVR